MKFANAAKWMLDILEQGCLAYRKEVLQYSVEPFSAVQPLLQWELTFIAANISRKTPLL